MLLCIIYIWLTMKYVDSFVPKLSWNASKMHNYARKIAKNIKNDAEVKVFLDFWNFLALRKVIRQLINLATRLPTTWKSGTQVQ